MDASTTAALASQADAAIPLVSTFAGARTGVVDVRVVSLDDDTATVLVGGINYTLPIDVDYHAPTGHGGGSGIAWCVWWGQIDEATDAAIGEHCDAIEAAINDHGARA